MNLIVAKSVSNARSDWNFFTVVSSRIKQWIALNTGIFGRSKNWGSREATVSTEPCASNARVAGRRRRRRRHRQCQLINFKVFAFRRIKLQYADRWTDLRLRNRPIAVWLLIRLVTHQLAQLHLATGKRAKEPPARSVRELWRWIPRRFVVAFRRCPTSMPSRSSKLITILHHSLDRFIFRRSRDSIR